MGSKKRDEWFATKIQTAPTWQEYLIALQKSPYKTHKRMAEALMPVLKDLINEQQQLVEEIKEVSNGETYDERTQTDLC